MTPSSVWACGGKDKCKKETTEHTNEYKSKPQSKCKSKCQKDCCKKPCSDSKNNKKGCCGDDCSCSPVITIMGDLPIPLFLENARFYAVFNIKNAFFYKQSSSKSAIQDILQPPITAFRI